MDVVAEAEGNHLHDFRVAHGEVDFRFLPAGVQAAQALKITKPTLPLNTTKVRQINKWTPPQNSGEIP